MPSRRAVFLDRDGTLNVQAIRNGLPFSPESLDEFVLFPDVPHGCRALAAAEYVLVVATNQPYVGRGLHSASLVEAMHARLRAAIPEIARIEVCYDPGRGEVSRRRKPEPGMLIDAAAALDLDLAGSWMIGDRWRDVECGQRAGVCTVLIDFGYAEERPTHPDFLVKTFAEAVAVILAHPDAVRRTADAR